jgi:hypothetical protein
MAMEKDELIAKMEHARTQLNAALEKVTPQKEIYPTWKIKQLMDHITGWDELVATAFHAHAQGGAPAKVVKHGIDQYNAESVNARKALSYEQSRQAYDASCVTVIQSLREMPFDRLEIKFQAPWGGMCTVSSVVKIFVSHEMEHARHIEESLNKYFKPS